MPHVGARASERGIATVAPTIRRTSAINQSLRRGSLRPGEASVRTGSVDRFDFARAATSPAPRDLRRSL